MRVRRVEPVREVEPIGLCGSQRPALIGQALLSISLGKRIAAMFDQVVCVSGAFGAFRREALDDVAALDAGGGEDLDITLRLRRRGWGIVFVEDAVCYTDVPANAMTFLVE